MRRLDRESLPCRNGKPSGGSGREPAQSNQQNGKDSRGEGNELARHQHRDGRSSADGGRDQRRRSQPDSRPTRPTRDPLGAKVLQLTLPCSPADCSW